MKKPLLVPAAGILAIALIVIAFVVGGESPGSTDSLRKVVSFYRDNDSEQMIAASFLGWGTALFMLFAAGFWRMVRNAETERHGASTLLLLGSAVWAVGASIFSGLTFTLGDVADDIPPSAIQALNALNSDMFFTVALGSFAFSIGAGFSVLTTAVLPRWLGWLAIVIGIISITPVGFFGFLAMGVWIVLASVVLLMRAGATPAPAAP